MPPNLEGLTEQQAYEKGREEARRRTVLNNRTFGLLGGVGWGESYSEMQAAAGASPFARGPQAAYYRGLSGSDYGQRLAKNQEMQTSRSLYLGSKAFQNVATVASKGLTEIPDAALRRFTGKGWTEHLAGETQKESLEAFRSAAADLYGDWEAGRMADTAQIAGLGMDLVGAVAALRGTAGGLNAIRTATGATAGAVTGAGSALLATKAGQAAVGAGKGIAAAGGKFLANTVGRVAPRAYNVVANTARASAGAVGRTVGHFVGNAPVQTMEAYRKLSAASRAAHGMADVYNEGQEPTSFTGGVLDAVAYGVDGAIGWAPYGAGLSSLGAGISPLWTAARLPGIVKKPLDYAFGAMPTTPGIKGWLRNIPRAIVQDATKGTVVNVAMQPGQVDLRNISGTLQNVGWQTGPILDYALRLGSKNYRTIATLEDANSEKALEAQEGWIDQYMSNPDKLNDLRRRYNLGPDVSDSDVRKLLVNTQSGLRQDDVYNDYYARLDSGFNWAGSSPEQIQAKVNEYSPEDRRRLLYKAYRSDMLQGYEQGVPAYVNDPNISEEDRTKLTELYIQQLYARKYGTAKLAFNSLRDRDGIVSTVMQDNPYAYATMLTLLTRGTAGVLNGGEGSDNSLSAANVIYRNLTPEDQQGYVDWTVQNTAADVLADKMASGGADSLEGLDPDLAKQLEAGYMERLSTDGNFASDVFMTIASSGKGVSTPSDPGTADRIAALANSADPQKIFDTMDDQHFLKLAKTFGASSGDGSGALSFLPEQQRQELSEKITAAAKQRAWRAIKNDPLTALPTLASVWCSRQGWDRVGTLVENPAVFFGTAAVLLGGTVLAGLSLFSGGQEKGTGQRAGGDQSAEGLMAALRGAQRQQQQQQLLSPAEQDERIIEQLAG